MLFDRKTTAAILNYCAHKLRVHSYYNSHYPTGAHGNGDHDCYYDLAQATKALQERGVTQATANDIFRLRLQMREKITPYSSTAWENWKRLFGNHLERGPKFQFSFIGDAHVAG